MSSVESAACACLWRFFMAGCGHPSMLLLLILVLCGRAVCCLRASPFIYKGSELRTALYGEESTRPSLVACFPLNADWLLAPLPSRSPVLLVCFNRKRRITYILSLFLSSLWLAQCVCVLCEPLSSPHSLPPSLPPAGINPSSSLPLCSLPIATQSRHQMASGGGREGWCSDCLPLLFIPLSNYSPSPSYHSPSGPEM